MTKNNKNFSISMLLLNVRRIMSHTGITAYSKPKHSIICYEFESNQKWWQFKNMFLFAAVFIQVLWMAFKFVKYDNIRNDEAIDWTFHLSCWFCFKLLCFGFLLIDAISSHYSHPSTHSSSGTIFVRGIPLHCKR